MGNGRFRVEGILPGRYLALALPPEQGLFANATPALFEALAKHATPVVLQENEQKVLDLRLASLR